MAARHAMRAGVAGSILLAVATATTPMAQGASDDAMFEDGLFRRCIAWLMQGEGGALIDNLCESRYAIPTPSMFQCARQTLTGFKTANDREVCAVIFEEQAKKARAGRVN